MSTDTDAVATAFADLVGQPATGVWAAPGRVNLIGEHTDYNDGFVMPFALPQRVTVAAGPRSDGSWRVTTLNGDRTETFTRADLLPGMSGWQAYVAGVVWALDEAGHQVSGADLVLTSDVPIGAGLSSSAALECAALTVFADLDQLQVEPMERARLARRAENAFVGAPTGQMDQAASMLCEAGNALFFDCRTFAVEQVPLDLPAAGLELLVLDTKTPHALVDSEYAARRASCEAAAQILGVPALRDVTDLDAALARLDDEVMRKRVRHVVTENQRVLDAKERLQAQDYPGLAPLLDASHVSMRDDFEITVPTVDLAVRTATEAGAHGARMTGGGFGGCIIALVDAGRSEQVAAAIGEAFAAAGYGPPVHFVGVPSDGARRLR
ncbi:MAG TPA: galactokinase [Microlunatus sp.]|nr:galactokinase [Microlunatus sp.]